jgi:sugar lactone lactonase YvrE
MLRRQVSLKDAALLFFIVLAAIYALYWRGLVYRPPMKPPGMGGGGPPGGGRAAAMGREDVRVETLAGGEPGYRDGAGWAARFDGPNALALASDGTLFIADSRNHCIRRLAPGGKVTTEAGGGEPGGPGGRAAGAAAAARFRYPSGVAWAPDGTLYIADSGNHRLCRLRDGQVTELAGGTEGRADGAGPAAQFRWPAALALAPDGALWVADAGNGVARRVDPGGQVTTPAPPPVIAAALGLVAPANPPATIFASPDARGMPVATLYTAGRASPYLGSATLAVFGDVDHHVLMAQRPGEPPLLIAGIREAKPAIADGPGNRAAFALPGAVVLAADGTAYVAEYEGNRIRRVFLPGWLVQGEPPQAAGRRRRF